MDTMMGIVQQVIPHDDILTLAGVFVGYSFIGWVVESIYMSWCNHKITNRGFARGPFCPIYGMGEFLIYNVILDSFADNLLLVFLVSSVMATLFELLVAKLMIWKLGYVWWDYTNKPFNYKGIICLESTIAWGIYGICEVTFLRASIIRLVHFLPVKLLIAAFIMIGVIYLLDSGTQLRKILHGDVKESANNLMKVK